MERHHRALLLFGVLLVILVSGVWILRSPGPRPLPPSDVGTPCKSVCAANATLICSAGTCQTCNTTAQCHHRHPQFTCEAGLCLHKELLPLDGSDIATGVFLVITVAVASGGGIGGGGILVALYVMIAHFNAHEAIPLSKATIFGGALANFLYFVRERHPTANRPRIDYNIALVLEPMTLCGTTIGVICNHIFPETLILVLLVIILGLTTYRTASKGMQIWHKESKLKVEPTGEERTLLTDAGPSYETVAQEEGEEDIVRSAEDEALLRSILEEEAAPIPYVKVAILCGLWALMLFVEFMRGGTEGGFVKCGGAAYWFLFFMIFPFAIALTYFTGSYLCELHETKKRIGFKFHAGDTEWTERNTRLFPIACAGAGWIAGLLGVGGGMIKGPLLLELGVLPRIQSATTAFMVLFTASCTSIQFLILGAMRLDYALYFAVAGFVATLFGQTVIGWLVNKYNKTSFIVLSLALVLGVSVILIGITGLRGVERREQLHMSDGFRELCRS